MKEVTVKLINGPDMADPLWDADTLQLRLVNNEGAKYGFVSERYDKGAIQLSDVIRFFEAAAANLRKFEKAATPQELSVTNQ